MASILQGVRVLDLTHVLAGPFAGYQLAVMGAEVIKIESPHEPDQARYQGSDHQLNDAGMGTAFLAQASNKKALSLDLKKEKGRDILRKLVLTADVLIENYRPGALASLGLGYDDMAVLNPKLVYCSISAFGSTGPKRELTAYDGVIQAYSGMMAMTGEPKTNPVKCGAPVVDYATGTTAAMAILAALLQRSQTDGKGQFVDVAMSDVAMILCSSHLTGFLWNGAHPEQKGNRYPFATLGCYQAADGSLMISASNLRQQRRLWEVLGCEHMVKRNNRERLKGYAEEAELLTRIISTQPIAHWERLLNSARVPVSRVQRMEDMLTDEHTQQRELLHRFPLTPGQLSGLTVPVAAFRLSSARAEVHTPPQSVGAQNRDLLSELGYGPSEMDALEAEGVTS
ncbi:crotonobetainyl-CoA:carnitine CoA-transferase CaiB-like acyl-CoA transferase [Hydrogenophaga palleronii]|uniref:Crotonobetainyl-CoA:carnitine CoA-transferase CaiB-like acyl-CoA transferase n=1 Tax=Hydrogenophaga palleronii TaxID=65655 RepID=A0ABU1WRJ2_9BURK|nr:CoA transferase [Hydrogenophaga palleronii]MDR7151924.1 crotonobetainyl-CoA:carnitine CoA-transferase CaiB-like acyl-CoA transferase [Hydrogenophaga palleronii]